MEEPAADDPDREQGQGRRRAEQPRGGEPAPDQGREGQHEQHTQPAEHRDARVDLQRQVGPERRAVALEQTDQRPGRSKASSTTNPPR
ncbi:hypothetical protein ACFQX7_05995 [Luedemannella flava]